MNLRKFFSARAAGIVVCVSLSTPGSSAVAKKPKSGAGAEVSLRVLLNAATKHSPVLNRAHLDVEKARGDKITASSVEAWQLAAGLRANLSARDIQTPDASQNVQEQNLQSDLALSKLLPSGGILSIDLRAQKDQGTATPGSAEAGGINTSAGLRLEQPLSRFRGQTREQLRNSQAQLAKEIAYCRLRSAAIDEVYRIASAYRGLAVAEEVLRIRKESLELAKQQLAVATAAVRSGVAAESEKSAVEQARYTREAAVVAAQYDRMEQSLTLRELVGMQIGPSDSLLESRGLRSGEPKRRKLKATLRKVLATNPRIMIADLELLVSREARRGAQREARPALDLVVAGRAEQQGYEVSAGLSMQWDIGGRFGRGLRKSAASQELSSKISLVQAERAATAEAIRYWSRLEAAREQAQFAEQALQFAERNVVLEQKRFKAGDVSSFDVLLRQDELARARIAALQARVTLLNSADRLAATTGELLNNYDLILDPELDY